MAWHEALGLVGVATIVGAYLLLQLGRLDPRRPVYPAANGVGAGLVLLSLVFDFNLAAFVVEGFWVLISLFGVVRALRGRGRALSRAAPRPRWRS